MKKILIVIMTLVSTFSLASININITLSELLNDELERIQEVGYNVNGKLLFYRSVDFHIKRSEQDGNTLTETEKEDIIALYYPLTNEKDAASLCAESQKLIELEERVIKLLLLAFKNTDEVNRAKIWEYHGKLRELDLMACGYGYRLSTLEKIRSYDFYEGIVDFYMKQRPKLEKAVEGSRQFKALLREMIIEFK